MAWELSTKVRWAAVVHQVTALRKRAAGPVASCLHTSTEMQSNFRSGDGRKPEAFEMAW